jgi:molybdopterin adenylyltransferase
MPKRHPIRVVTATVSDTRTLETDESGRLLASLLEETGARLVTHHLVADEAEAIAALVEAACASSEVDAVLLTGGTGIAERDVTIEAVTPLLEKELPGFGEAFRRLSFDEIGARALLSRAIAGTRERTFVAALPGSPGAVKLAMTSLLVPVLDHAVALLSGRTHHHHHPKKGE